LNGQEGWSARLRGSYASADEGLSESVLLATGSSGWQGLVVFVRHDGHGQGNQGTNETASTARTAPNPQDASSNGVLAKLVRKISASRRLRLTYEHGDSEIDTRILSAITATTLDLVAHDTMNRDRVTLDHSWEGEGLFFDRAFNAFSYQIGTTRQFSAEDRTPAADRTRNNTFNNRTVSLTTELQSAGTTGALSHRFVYGGDISKTRQEGIRDGTIPPLGEVFPTRAFPNTDYVLAGLFLQDEITFGSSGIRIYPALRFDYYNLEPNADALYLVPSAGQSDEHLSPKLGLVWQASNWFQVFANYAQGFKAPAPSQVNSQFTNSAFFYTSIPNPNLKPETSETLEGGVRLSGSNWSAGATAFTGEYTDFIDLVQVGGTFTPPSPGDPDGDFAVFQNVNLNRVQINGAEARAQAAFDNGISLLAAASLARGSTVDAGVKAPFEAVDPWKLVGGISYVDPRGFGGQLFHTHSAQKQVSRVACGATCFRPEGFTIWDATAYWDITHDITLRAALFNITDETYWWWSDVRTAGLTMTSASRDAYTQPGRNISVSLALKI
jgi:hemoglobin/transferrin/lactoferrin receptor protein